MKKPSEQELKPQINQTAVNPVVTVWKPNKRISFIQISPVRKQETPVISQKILDMKPKPIER